MYTMNEVYNISKIAINDVEQYLLTLKSTLGIINVEDNPIYQQKDIDLLLVTDKSKTPQVITVEVKADRWYNTGNYFFETVSNFDKNTLGCFMYTEADYLFYYFIEPKELHILPMPETRNWFIENKHRFKTKYTKSLVGQDTYSSAGRTVPREILLQEVKGAKVISLKKF